MILCFSNNVIYAEDFQVKNFSPKIMFENKYLTFSTPIFMYEDLTYVSLRDFCNILKYDVRWNEDINTILIEQESKKNNLVKNEEIAYKIGKVLLESYCNSSLEYMDDEFKFYLNVIESENFWTLKQEVLYKNSYFYAGNIISPFIKINKEDGKVLEISSDSSEIDDMVKNISNQKHD